MNDSFFGGMFMNKVKLDVTREVRTFWDLNNASYVMNEKTKENREGSYYTIMASLIFSVFLTT